MLEFTCPKCQTTNRTEADTGGQVVACAGCDQPLGVVPPDEGGEQSGPGKIGGGWNSPLVAGFGGLAGLAVASLMLVAWYGLGRGVPAEARPPLEGIKEWAVVATERPPEKDDPGPIAPSDEPGLTGEQISRRLRKSACWIVAEERQGEKPVVRSGSGTLVDRVERLVLTNEHVANNQSTAVYVLFPTYRNGKLVTDNAEYKAEIRSGNGIKARVVREGVDRRRDLALLQLERLPEDVVPLRLASRPPQQGQQIHTLGGSPEGNQGQWIYSDGKVRGIFKERWNYSDGVEREAEVIASTVSINRGDSGGGAVNDRCVLVGVNNAAAPGQSNSRHISITEVIDFLSRYYKSTGKDWTPPAEGAGPATAEKEVVRLLEELESGNKEDRGRAVNGLRDLDAGAREAIPALVKVARDPGEPAELREAVVEALTAIGSPSRDHLQVVLEALNDEKTSPELRRYAAGALGPLAVKVTDAATALLMAVKDKDAVVRQQVATSLGKVGGADKEKKARPALAGLLRDPEKAVRRTAFNTLIGFGDPDKSQIDFAKEKKAFADRSAPTEARSYSCLLLALAEEDETPAICEALQANTDFQLAWIVLNVLDALDKEKTKTNEVERALSRALAHKEKVVRWRAAQVLVNIGFDPVLFPAYLKAVSSTDSLVWVKPLNKMITFNPFSTFEKKEAPALNLSKDSLNSLQAALDGQDPLARRVAAYALGTMGADGAAAAPKLRAALKKETMTFARLEMLTTFAKMGPAALKEPGGQGEVLLEELAEIANDARADTKNQQVCAAIALVRLAPTSSQGKQAYPILARAMLLKNAPRPVVEAPAAPAPPAGGFVPPRGPRRPVGGMVPPPLPPAAKAPDSVELELHERAKQALAKGGRDAADALAATCRNSFIGNTSDTFDTQSDKRYARRTTFEVLARIGPDANTPLVQGLIRYIRNLSKTKGRGEFPEVIAAVNEADTAIKRTASKPNPGKK
jgi:HEAT repeat protein